MLMNRIIGALTFRQGVYDEVENDPAFTSSAWMIVAAVAFLSQLGANAAVLQSEAGLTGWLIGTVVGTIIAVVAFALACAIVAWVGRSIFHATATFDEMVRTLGLAYVWNVVALIAIVGAIAPALACVAAPITLIAAILGLIASAIALKAALDLDWVQTIITAVIAWVVIFVMSLLVGVVLGLLGFAGATLTQPLPQP